MPRIKANRASRECLHCKKTFNPFLPSHKFCKKECRRVYLNEHYVSLKVPIQKTCKFCKNQFSTIAKIRRYCSQKCKVADYRSKIKIKRRIDAAKLRQKRAAEFRCKQCGKPIQIISGREDTSLRRKWCSMNCAQKNHEINNLSRKLRKKIGVRIHELIKGKGPKNGSARHYLGCSADDYRQWIEAQWKQGMTWVNYGKEWQIDHILPCSGFDMNKEWHRRVCFHFTNTRPLWKLENILKSDKIIRPQMLLPV